MSKFFVNPTAAAGSSILITDKNDIKHITKALRMREGDKLEISDGVAYEYITVIDQISGDGITCRIHDKQNFAKEPKIQVTLFQGIPKQGKMETIIQKTTEMGIKAIVPVFTARTIVEDSGNFDKKISRWQKVSGEAAKQCKRGYIPVVESAVYFPQMLEKLKNCGFDMVLFPYENEQKVTIKLILESASSKINIAQKCDNVPQNNETPKNNKASLNNETPQRIAVIIGPEGGFSDEEAKCLQDIGALSVSLGKTTLRTETAGIVALSMIMYELEM